MESSGFDRAVLERGGLTFEENGFQTSSELWTASLFRERGVEAILGAHVEKVEPAVVHYETLDGEPLREDPVIRKQIARLATEAEVDEAEARELSYGRRLTCIGSSGVYGALADGVGGYDALDPLA